MQGPIDDAFMDSFIMVRPTGKPLSDKVGAWVAAEQRHAVEHWRRQFRGEARVKEDDAVTEEDIAESKVGGEVEGGVETCVDSGSGDSASEGGSYRSIAVEYLSHGGEVW